MTAIIELPTLTLQVNKAWAALEAGFQTGDSKALQTQRLWAFAQDVLCKAAEVARSANRTDIALRGGSEHASILPFERAAVQQATLEITTQLLTMALNCSSETADTLPRPRPQAGEEPHEQDSSSPSDHPSERQPGA